MGTLNMFFTFIKRKILFILAMFFIIFGYYLLSEIKNNQLIYPKIPTIIDYFRSLSFATIVTHVSATVYKTIYGYLLALISSIILAIATKHFKLDKFIMPFISILKTVPTISVIIIAYIWFGRERSVYFVLFLVIFPILYETFYHHLKYVNQSLLEVCQVYQFSLIKKIRYFYFYHLLEGFLLSFKQTFGLCFKIMVMAEVIGQVRVGIGAQIVNENINFVMEGIFAWTIILVTIVVCIDYSIDGLKKVVLKWKSYVDVQIYNEFKITLHDKRINVILGPSGCGKTTLLQCIANLIPYEGTIEPMPKKIGYVFQDDRLFPYLTIIQNLKIINNDIQAIHHFLKEFQVDAVKHQYPKALSGGERQRISLIRAFIDDNDMILMDEPFKSLDYNLKQHLVECVLNMQKETQKTIVLVTHDLPIALYLGHHIHVLSSKPTRVVESIDNPFTHQELNEESVVLLNHIKNILI